MKHITNKLDFIELLILLSLVLVFIVNSFEIRDLKERIGVLEQEVISQQQYIEAFHGALINHRNNIEALLERLENWII